jgi:energy-converting hydrogenase Eha subunit B
MPILEPGGVDTSTFTGRLLDKQRPWASSDHQLLLIAFGAMFEQIAHLVNEQGDDSDADFVPGWGVLFDPDLCPTWALPYLGQFVGVGNLVGVPDATARALIKSQPRHRRGTPRSIVQAAAATLTGTQTVVLTEFYLGDPYQLSAVTYTAETPDPSVTLAAMLANKPAGILLTYNVFAGWLISTMEATYASRTIGDLEAAFTSIEDLEANV